MRLPRPHVPLNLIDTLLQVKRVLHIKPGAYAACIMRPDRGSDRRRLRPHAALASSRSLHRHAAATQALASCDAVSIVMPLEYSD
jgi:hypothetical protein